MKNKQGSRQSLKTELRTYAAKHPMTVRTSADGSKQVSGYAIVFNSLSVELGGFAEICSPGMLTRTLRENPDVLALRDHKQELLLGRTTAGTLSLRVDHNGLAFTITLPKTNIGDDTAENVRLQNLTGVSFGFQTVDDSWAVDSDGNVVRTLLDVNLFEISITSFAAYTATSVNTRSCPVTLRDKLKRDDTDDCDPDDMDEDGNCPDDDEERDCSCDCEQCVAGDCDECSDENCEDDTCLDSDCPNQDDIRCDRLRLRTLFALKANSYEHEI